MITKKQALEEGIELWTILAQTGEQNRLKIPGPWQNYINRCPCCKYVKEQTGKIDCHYCPLVWYGDDRGLNQGRTVYLCCEDGSPYRAWLNAESVKYLKLWAQKIVDLHKKALEQLENENG